jgi:Mg-chelatase subunit ChlD
MAKGKKETKTDLNAYILLDRSGSMSGRWAEALSSINAYVEGLAKSDVPAKVTLATFDGQDGLQFDVIRDAVAAKKWNVVTGADATPRGMTPLFDALGRAVALAEKANDDKTVIVVMTDGAENHSREVTKQGAKTALDRCKAKGWQVVFLGADFDAFGEAAQVGVAAGQSLNMAAGNYGATMRNLATQTVCYAASADTSISFSAEDRAVASGKLKP